MTEKKSFIDIDNFKYIYLIYSSNYRNSEFYFHYLIPHDKEIYQILEKCIEKWGFDFNMELLEEINIEQLKIILCTQQKLMVNFNYYIVKSLDINELKLIYEQMEKNIIDGCKEVVELINKNAEIYKL